MNLDSDSGFPIWQESLLGVEILLLHATPVYYGIGIPHGRGAGVVMIPGFLANDAYLIEMYAWLKRIGYRPYYSGIGINADCPNLQIVESLIETVNRARRETGKKVHLIGHSLGGMMARSLAAGRAAEVASVISLASPFRRDVVHPRIRKLVEVVRREILRRQHDRVLPSCYTAECTCSFLKYLREQLPESIGETAIYTRNDGIVDWRYCKTGNPASDFEVTGTHLGLTFNPDVYRIIAHRLADPRSRPF